MTEEPPPSETSSNPAPSAADPPKRIVRRRRRRQTKNSDDDIPALEPALLEKVMKESGLPTAYSFEVPKTVERIVKLRAKHVALQMPEGLLMYSTVLADVLQKLSQSLIATITQAKAEKSSESTTNGGSAPTETNSPPSVCEQISVLGDVTYGACCIDDLGAQALGADLLVHYGHSCLVPLQHTVVPCLYVFVEIQMDVPHMVDSLDATIVQDTPDRNVVVYLLGTIQFRHCFGQAVELLQAKGYETVFIPQVKPLSPGEVLGCTSPKLDHHQPDQKTVCCFVADGRFHLESTLISNPHIGIYYRYDPYGKSLTIESYGHEEMKSIRYAAIQQAKAAISYASTEKPATFGIILGTLGRQGNPAIIQRIKSALKQKQQSNGQPTCRSFVMLLSEITPAKLALLDSKVDVWVQVACPRLSVDWGHFLSQNKKPVLSPYELFVALEETEWKDVYPMDFYAQTGGPWANYHADNKAREITVGNSLS